MSVETVPLDCGGDEDAAATLTNGGYVTLEQAICFAAQVHEGQVDKAGSPYILHPLRVMLRLRDLAGRRVAMLHDVVEDGGVTLDVLRRKGLPEEEVLAIAALSRDKAKETYSDFIERLSAGVESHPIADTLRSLLEETGLRSGHVLQGFRCHQEE